jgi:hypothetical protein
MNYIDYFAFKIYKTHLRFYKIAPGFSRYGPLSSAAFTAALYPVSLLFSFSVLLGVWDHVDYGVWQFITVLFIVFAWFLLSSYFELKIKKTRDHYFKETKKQCVSGAIVVNIVISLCVFILATVILYKL